MNTELPNYFSCHKLFNKSTINCDFNKIWSVFLKMLSYINPSFYHEHPFYSSHKYIPQRRQEKTIYTKIERHCDMYQKQQIKKEIVKMLEHLIFPISYSFRRLLMQSRTTSLQISASYGSDVVQACHWKTARA